MESVVLNTSPVPFCSNIEWVLRGPLLWIHQGNSAGVRFVKYGQGRLDPFSKR